MKFFKAFSGEESVRQKHIRMYFHSRFTRFFSSLMHITRFDKFLQWQQNTSRRNQVILLFAMGTLIILVNISLFTRESSPTDTTANSNWAIIQSMNTEEKTEVTNNPRVLRLAELFDSLNVNEKRMEHDSAYKDRIQQFILRKMEEENLMPLPTKVKNQIKK